MSDDTFDGETPDQKRAAEKRKAAAEAATESGRKAEPSKAKSRKQTTR